MKRLTQLGLVTCGLRPGGSQRNKVVFLTDEGAARIKRALHRVFTGRALARHYRRYVAKSYFKKPRNFAWLIAQELDRLWYELQDIARHHFDRSEVLYSIRSKPDH